MKRTLACLTLIGAILVASEAAACPRCKDALGQKKDPEAVRLAQGFSYSIYLLLGMPFALLTAGSIAIVRAVRQGQVPEL